MTDTLPPPVPAQAPTPQKGRNCWLVGCSGCLIALLLLIAIVSVAFWSLRRSVMVDPFDPVELQPAEQAIADAKLQSFNLLNREGRLPDDFTFPAQGIQLTEREVNYWISKMDNELADAVRLNFEPGHITVEMRVGDRSRSRWLINAELSVEQMESGPDVRLVNARLGRYGLPKAILEEISKENLIKELLDDQETRKEIESHVGRIEVLKDEILIIPKQNP
jgi:hypothetical protein